MTNRFILKYQNNIYAQTAVEVYGYLGVGYIVRYEYT